ncbi:MAG: flavodoxin [Ruminococcus sp.]|nr:flavodoxin [Ruminococcus sp.]
MGKILTAYFSAEGTTAGLAERISKAAGGDIFEIAPEEPYSKADINWKNPLSRCNKEKIGKKDIPIKGKVEGFEEYTTVFVGFPIWYYGAPNIINSFMKQYDWSGKRIALFATSGGSDIGKTVGKLRPYVSGDYRIIAAEVFKPDADITEWVKGIVK